MLHIINCTEQEGAKLSLFDSLITVYFFLFLAFNFQILWEGFFTLLQALKIVLLDVIQFQWSISYATLDHTSVLLGLLALEAIGSASLWPSFWNSCPKSPSLNSFPVSVFFLLSKKFQNHFLFYLQPSRHFYSVSTALSGKAEIVLKISRKKSLATHPPFFVQEIQRCGF